MSSWPLSIVSRTSNVLAVEQLARDPAERRRAEEDDPLVAELGERDAVERREAVAVRDEQHEVLLESFVTQIPAGVCDSNAVSLMLTMPRSSRPVLTRRNTSAVSWSPPLEQHLDVLVRALELGEQLGDPVEDLRHGQRDAQLRAARLAPAPDRPLDVG